MGKILIATAVVLVGLLVNPALAAPTPEWKADLAGVTIPSQPVTGRIRGRAFTMEKAEFKNGNLKLRQGKEFFADLEVTVFFFGDVSKKPAGQTVEITPKSGFGSPHIHISSKDAPKDLPRSDIFMTSGKDRYVMRLKFGAVSGGKLPGQIYLCTMDAKKSFVAGTFVADFKK